MNATVTVWNHKGDGKTTQRACEIIGRRAAPRWYSEHWGAETGKAADWYDVRTLDGVTYRNCNPLCVREA